MTDTGRCDYSKVTEKYYDDRMLKDMPPVRVSCHDDFLTDLLKRKPTLTHVVVKYGHFLYKIYDNDTKESVGYAFMKQNCKSKRLDIFEIEIYEEFRRKG